LESEREPPFALPAPAAIRCSDHLSKADRERVKLASRSLLDSVRKLIAPLERWTEKEQTQAEVQVFILHHLFQVLPTPPFTTGEKQAPSLRVYQHVWQQSASGLFPGTVGT